MELKDAVAILRDYNKWRRVMAPERHDPEVVGEAIDAVCDLLDAGDGLQITIKATSRSKLAKERNAAREKIAELFGKEAAK